MPTVTIERDGKYELIGSGLCLNGSQIEPGEHQVKAGDIIRYDDGTEIYEHITIKKLPQPR